MAGRLEATGEALRSPIPWVVASAAIALTAAAWFAVERGRHEAARQQFERRVETATGAVRARVLAYEQVARAAAAHMASDTEVTRANWRAFIAHLQLGERFPGIRSIGYAEHLTPATLPAHVSRVRAEGFSDYQVAPHGGRREWAVVRYAEPAAARHALAMGEDLYADPVRAAAMDQARDSGEPAITGRVGLAGGIAGSGEGQQPGIIMFVPLFRPGTEELPRRDRPAAVTGYVFGAFRMQELLRGILDQGTLQTMDMRVYDQPATRGAQAELIDTGAARRTSRDRPPVFEQVAHFPMPGRTWTIHFVSRPDFDAALRADRPWLVIAGGALASVAMLVLSTALVVAWNRTHQLSMRDPLTGLHNRRYLDETMPRELARARRAGQDVGVIALDLDHFKRLNDTHGHEVGDRVLQRMGELLRSATRGGDIACRLGGEEFAVILPGATPEGARYRAESIRAAFNSIRVDDDGRDVGPLTLSAGVAALAPTSQDWAQALRQADRALYAAKQAGRNRVLTAADVA
jgi:diguanylate cyclase (GGDEF)-like protein